MKLVLQLLLVSFISLAGFTVNAQSGGSDSAEKSAEDGDSEDGEKSELTDEDRAQLQDATTAVGKLVDSIEADSTSRKTVKFASKELRKLKAQVEKLQADDKFAEGDGEKLLSAVASMNEKLRPINRNLKAGETDRVEDDLPNLKRQMDVLNETIKGLK